MIATITYDNGNLLSYTDTGDPAGFPVLVQHGMIASNRDTGLFEHLTRAGRRVISIARPGYGQSSPTVMATMAGWGDIVATLARELGLARFDVLGISSGAPYGYAIGHRLPDRVRTLYILSGTPALYDARVQALWPYPIRPDATLPELQAVAHALFFSGLSDADLARDDIRDSMAHDCFGIAQDLHLRCIDWGFALADLTVPVVMQHGQTDDQVPFATAEATARMLPNCRFLVREDSTPFSAEVLNDFIARVMLTP
jgi:pimeloyl-ACP methyl ester carboxylesterase